MLFINNLGEVSLIMDHASLIQNKFSKLISANIIIFGSSNKKACAIANPIPPAPPVITMTLLWISNILLLRYYLFFSIKSKSLPKF